MDARTSRTRRAVLTAGLELMLSGGLDSITHTRVAAESGITRRTLYRHWPTRIALIRDVLASSSFPSYEHSGDPKTDVRAHLLQLRDALVHGPLAHILMALGERSALDPAFAQLRTVLVEEGCAPLRAVLTRASETVALGDIEQAITNLEGPLFYAVCVRGSAPTDDQIDALVDRYLPMTRHASR